MTAPLGGENMPQTAPIAIAASLALAGIIAGSLVFLIAISRELDRADGILPPRKYVEIL